LNPAVEVSSVSKTYPQSNRASLFWNALRKKHSEDGFEALKNISFKAFKGDVIGVVGLNGSGKSTLLQIISGTLTPTRGSVNLSGNLTAVLELGSGFDSNFSGKENARTYLSTLGLVKSEINRKIQEIIDFSELEEFADFPIRTYSTGMIARLAFATAVCVNPEILVLDEVFSVGDQTFSRKSFNRIKEFIKNDKTVFLCSHSAYHIQMVCNKTLYLKNGELIFFGPTKDALKLYDDDAEKISKNGISSSKYEVESSKKSQNVNISRVTILKNDILLDQYDNSDRFFQSGTDTLGLKLQFEYDYNQLPPQIGIVIHDSNRRPIACAGSHFDNFQYKKEVDGLNEVKICFPKIKLLKGDYELDVFLLCENGFLLLDHLTLSPRIKIKQKSNEVGLFLIDHSWEDLSR
jgi:lipopolysaccharide transport system ATP-binding protein